MKQKKIPPGIVGFASGVDLVEQGERFPPIWKGGAVLILSRFRGVAKL